MIDQGVTGSTGVSSSVANVEQVVTAASTVASIATLNPEILALTQTAELLINAIIELSSAKQTGVISNASWNVLTSSIKKDVAGWNAAK